MFFNLKYKNITDLTYIRPMFPFYLPIKHQENYFVLGEIKMGYSSEMT